ncbi:MAG: hypothetical protein JSV88_18530, partial [Candidatus Aminicenantes bacterium]
KTFIFGVLITVLLLNGIYAANETGLQQVGQWIGDIYCSRVFVHNQKAYIYDSVQLVIVNVSDPTSPQKLGEITLPMDIMDLYVSGDYAYAVTSFGYFSEGNEGYNDHDGLRIIDISNSSSPQQVGFYHKLVPQCVYVSGQYAYVGSGDLNQFYSGSFDIVDITVPWSPQLTGRHSGDAIYDILSVEGTTYAVYYNRFHLGATGGVITVDTSDPTSPQLMNYFVTYRFILDIYDGDALPRTISRTNNLLLLTTDTASGGEYNRLFILDIPEPGTVTHLSTYEHPGPCYGLDVSGVYIYITSGDDLKVLDISDPFSPAAAVQPYTSGAPMDVFVSGDYVYVAEANNGLVILSAAGINTPPFGTFETPGEGAVTSGSIPVSGWVLDDKDIESVKIFRSPAADEGGSPVYLGDAVLVEGARPDVEQAFPAYPMNSRAGWGYMLLTNYNMPNQGNGPVTLIALTTDSNGAQTTLGSKTITLDNAHAVKPFGAIDTPAQGGTASGPNYINWGWALTPLPNTIPFDGSTINVYVDGINLGHPVYNLYREDIAGYFPGYNNSSGAVGYFFLDTTGYAEGVHTIAWSVTDDAGNSEGMGSRYFIIRQASNQDGTAAIKQRKSINPNQAIKRSFILTDTLSPVKTRKGFLTDAPMKTLFPDENGMIRVEIRELDRIEIHLEAEADSIPNTFNTQSPAFSLLSPQPVGSFFDRDKGIFYWLPGPGIKGTFELEFIITGIYGEASRKIIQVTISKK